MSKSRQELWLIRHGQTEWSAAKRHTGRTDIPLTPAGERQAAGLGQSLADGRFRLVHTSPLRRANKTCRLAGYGQAADVTDDLLEWAMASMKEERRRKSGWNSPIGPFGRRNELWMEARIKCNRNRAMENVRNI